MSQILEELAGNHIRRHHNAKDIVFRESVGFVDSLDSISNNWIPHPYIDNQRSSTTMAFSRCTDHHGTNPGRRLNACDP
jgi:pterin-4a-carbinolamine dehydratase